MASGGIQPLVGEALALFTEGISTTLSRWSALQMAVENEWGGRDSRRKAELLNSDVLSWFTQSREPLYIDDLEDKLEQAMICLNTVLEDGSVTEVAEKLMIMHGECSEGNLQSIESLRAATPQRVSYVRQAVNDDEDDSDSDDGDITGNDGISNMMVDMPESQPKSRSYSVEDVAEANDGGWVKVSGRNKGKRN